MRYKTRIAPTPSGYIHLGNCYSFVLTALVAHRYKASMLLRIDDMDRARYRESYVLDILESLRFLALPYDEGPVSLADFESNWSQLHRMDLYQQALNKLRDQGLVYACSCSRKDLNQYRVEGTLRCACHKENISLDAEDVSWRLKTDKRVIHMKGMNDSSQSLTLPDSMTDFVVRKRDRMPAYQVCSLLDDTHFGCNLLVRGEDLYESSIAQLFLADVLEEEGFKQSVFVHHNLIEEQGQKMSKTQGTSGVAHFRKAVDGRSKLWAMLGETLNAPKQIDSLASLIAVEYLPQAFTSINRSRTRSQGY